MTAPPERARPLLDLGLIALTALLINVVFIIPWVQGRFPFQGIRGEMLMQWLPYRIFMGHCFRDHLLPLWDPYIFGGMPFWGYSHTMSAYPPMLLSLVLSTLNGTCLFFAVHVLLACAGAYGLLRRLEFDRPLTVAGVLLVVGCGLGMLGINREFYLTPASWSWLFPLLYLGLRLAETPRRRWLLLWGAALGLQFLIGDVEGIVFNLGAVGLLLLLVRPGPAVLARNGRALALILPVLLAVLLAAAMWAPLAEYLPHSVRGGGVTFELYTSNPNRNQPGPAASPRLSSVLAVLLYPGSPVSWLVAIFAAYHLLRGRDRRSWVLAAAALVLGVYCLRMFPPLERLTYRLPGFNVFLKRLMGLGPAIFFVQLLALRGMKEFIERVGDRRPRWRLPARLAVILAVVVVHYAPFAGNIESRSADYLYSPLFREAVGRMDARSRYYLAAPLLDDAPHLYTQEGMVWERPEVFGWNRVPPRRYMDLIAKINPEAIRYEHGKLAGISFVFNQANGALLRSPALPLVDLLNVGYLLDQGLPVRHSSPCYLAWLLASEPAQDRAVPGRWRDLAVRELPLTVTFSPAPRQAIVLRLAWESCSPAGAKGPATILVQDGMSEPAAETIAIDCAAGGPGRSETVRSPLPPQTEGRRTIMLQARAPAELALSGLRFEAPAVEDPDAPLSLIYTNEVFDVFRNREALPAAFLASRLTVIDAPEQMLDLMARAGREELARTAFLTHAAMARAPELSAGGEWEVRGSVKELLHGPGRMVYQTASAGPAVLIVSENRLPGWTAWVDGVERPLLDVDHAFMGAPLSPGGHEVRLSYRPVGFRLGLWITLASALILGATLLFRRNMI
jgi:hypothetical protein